MCEKRSVMECGSLRGGARCFLRVKSRGRSSPVGLGIGVTEPAQEQAVQDGEA